MALAPANAESSASPGFVPVAIYTRVSTDNQVGGRFDSCESQAAVCREQIERRTNEGWREVACLTDAAYSGGTMDRPGIKALKRMIEAGEVKVVLIYKLERVLRSTDEWVPFRAFLKKHGCRLESATEDISESTPSGRLKNNLMMSFNQYERENAAEKTRTKMLQQAKRGIWNGGMVPYGYGYDRQSQRLVPHPQEAAVVRRIFEQSAQLVSLERIADALNREGLRTKTRLFRGRDGTERNVGARRFRSDGLRIIVTNPIYRGVLRYKGGEYPGQHEALVSPELWEKANAAVAKTTKPAQTIKPEQDKHFHLLKGLLVCGCCNRALAPHASGNKDRMGKPYRYYDCSHVVKERQDAVCPVRRVPAGSLERAVVQFLSEVGRHPDIISAAVGSSQTRRHGRRTELKTDLDALDRQLAEVNKGIRNCVESIAGGGKLIAEELAEQAAALKDRKREIAVKRERLAQELSVCDRDTLDERRVCDSVARFGKMLRGLSPDEQKSLVALFVEKIEVRPAKTEARADGLEERRFELQFKLNVPRLVEGMEERLVVQTDPIRPSLRRLSLSAEVALGQQGRSNEAKVTAPFHCEEEVARPRPPPTPASLAADVHHPLQRAIAWQREMAKNPKLSLRGFARKVGVVPPTITQHFKLLKLAPEIRDYVVRMRDPKAVHFFSLRRLMPLAKLPHSDQLRQFREWRVWFEQEMRPSVAAATAHPAVSPQQPACGIRPF